MCCRTQIIVTEPIVKLIQCEAHDVKTLILFLDADLNHSVQLSKSGVPHHTCIFMSKIITMLYQLRTLSDLASPDHKTAHRLQCTWALAYACTHQLDIAFKSGQRTCQEQRLRLPTMCILKISLQTE